MAIGDNSNCILIVTIILCSLFQLSPSEEQLMSTPFFENPKPRTLNVIEGQMAYLNCKIFQIGSKMVTWVRILQDNETIELITFGLASFHHDRRFSLRFQPPRNWKLRISATRPTDAGKYECQISTHPPLKKSFLLNIKNPTVTLKDEVGHPVHKSYVIIGSRYSLECFLHPVSIYSRAYPLWTFNNSREKLKSGRIRTDSVRGNDSLSLWLQFSEVELSDEGIYSCSIKGSKGQSMLLHVLKDASSAGHDVLGNCNFLSKILLLLLFFTQRQILMVF